MFKALHNNEEVISIDFQGDKEVASRLREMSRKGELLCPECKEPVRVRAGDKYRYHFAHISVGKCSLRGESPNVLTARSILYGWLKGKKLKYVTTEKTISSCEFAQTLPRPIDCYAEIENRLAIAYWIFEHGVRKIHTRIAMPKYFDSAGMAVNWVFLSFMLKLKSNSDRVVLLSTTERDFCFPTKYDTPYSFRGGSLHYLNIEESTLTTYRGAALYHYPNEFCFVKNFCNPIDMVLIDPRTGEFTHPGEYDNLLDHKRLIEAEEQELCEGDRSAKEQKTRLCDQLDTLWDVSPSKDHGKMMCECCDLGATYPGLCLKCPKRDMS